MNLRSLLDMSDLRLRPLVGGAGLDRPVRRVYTTDLPDPRRYLDGGDLVLTGMVWRRGPADSERFVAALADSGVAALAAGCGGIDLPEVPADLVAACRRHRLPLFEVPADVSFATITAQVTEALIAERAGTAGGPADRWRDRLHSLVTADAGPEQVCALLAGAAGTDCWVLSPLGRLIAGPRDRLTVPERATLAAGFLRADRSRASTRPVTVGHRTFALLPVSARVPRLDGWFLALAGGPTGWSPELAGLVVEVCTLLALQRSRHDEALRLAARQGEQLIRLARSEHAAPADVAARLQVAGFAPDEPVGVLIAGAEPARSVPVAAVLREICARYLPRSLVTTVGTDTVAVFAIHLDRFDQAVTWVRDGAEALRPGLDTARLVLGIAAAPASATGLRGALEEAGHARRLAGHRAGQIRLAASSELTSHGLLLATVPDELRRSFRAKLLGPVLDYDREHQSDLLATLEEFLACSGSWTRCAERLHLHVNTLRYRIGRIEQLTGRDLNSFPDRVDLFLALRLG